MLADESVIVEAVQDGSGYVSRRASPAGKDVFM